LSARPPPRDVIQVREKTSLVRAWFKPNAWMPRSGSRPRLVVPRLNHWLDPGGHSPGPAPYASVDFARKGHTCVEFLPALMGAENLLRRSALRAGKPAQFCCE